LEIVLFKICFVARIVSELETENSGWGAQKTEKSIQWKAGRAITKNSPKSLDSPQSSPRISSEFFGSGPMESHAMGYLGWSRKACRILVFKVSKKKYNTQNEQ